MPRLGEDEGDRVIGVDLVDAEILADLSGNEGRDAAVAAALERCGGRVQGPGGAADLLAVNPNTLRARMRRLGIPFGRAAQGYRPPTTTGRRSPGADNQRGQPRGGD